MIVVTFCGFHIHYHPLVDAFIHSGHSAEKDATDHGLEPRPKEHLMPQVVSGPTLCAGVGLVPSGTMVRTFNKLGPCLLLRL